MMRTGGNRRSGFTLIELLVVISIIAVLVGLTIPAVMKVRGSMKRSETQWQMNQISQAADQFTNAERLNRPGFIPTSFTLRPAYDLTNPAQAQDANYLRLIFPNLAVNPAGTVLTTATGTTVVPTVTFTDGNEIATFFLTGGEVTGYTGFSTNSQNPFEKPQVQGEVRNGPFLQLKSGMTQVVGGNAKLVDPYGTPYLILMSRKGDYGSQPAYWRGTPKKFEMPKGIQVISAGENRLFGGGGDWTGGITGAGEDDLANFSQSRLGVGAQ